jgi:RNA polymerase sigma-70 factor (ECF subfamily)
MKDRSIKHIGEASATDSRLLRAALDQDEAAWSELVRTYGGRIYRWARQGGLQDIDAAEVTNQVFVSVARGLPEFRQEKKGSSFRRWLRTITQHAVAAWYRAQNRDICPAVGGSDNRDILQLQAMSSIASSTGGHHGASAGEAAMERVRLRTDPKIWRIFLLVTAEQLTPAEVAVECDVSRNVVYITKHRLAKEIRQELSGGGGHDELPRESGGSNGPIGPMS